MVILPFREWMVGMCVSTAHFSYFTSNAIYKEHNKMISYQKYADLLDTTKFNRLADEPPLKGGEDGTGIPVQKYSVKRITFENAIDKRAKLSKYDLLPDDRMVRVKLRIPQHLHNGVECPEDIDVFKHECSDALLQKIQKDFFDTSIKVKTFNQKYKFKGETMLKVISKLHLDMWDDFPYMPGFDKPTRLWFIRNKYRGSTITFCLHASNNGCRLWKVFVNNTLEEFIKQLYDEFSNEEANNVEYVCGNFNIEIMCSVWKKFKNAQYIPDFFQTAVFMDYLVTLTQDMHLKSNLRVIKKRILDLFNRNNAANTPADLEHCIQQINELRSKYPNEKDVINEITEFINLYQYFCRELNADKNPNDGSKLLTTQFKLVSYKKFLPYRLYDLLDKHTQTEKFSAIRIAMQIMRRMAELQKDSFDLSATLQHCQTRNYKPLTLHCVHALGILADDTSARRKSKHIYQKEWETYSLLMPEISSVGIDLEYVYDIYNEVLNDES